MLNTGHLASKSYEEIYAEMLRLIPMYSSEWTNFNPSDPGITILQTLSMLTMWQDNAINQPNRRVIERLLSLCHQENHGVVASETIVLVGADQDQVISAGSRIVSGGVPFDVCEDTPISAIAIVSLLFWPSNRMTVRS